MEHVWAGLKMYVLCSLLLVVAGGIYVSVSGDKSLDRPKPTPGIVHIDGEDAGLAAAIAKAKTGLPRFIEELKKPRGRTFAVCTGLKDDCGNIESTWLIDISYKNGTFTGVVADPPLNVRHLKRGDKLVVPKAEIDDWGISDGKVSVGCYTVKVLADREAIGQVLPPRSSATPQ